MKNINFLKFLYNSHKNHHITFMKKKQKNYLQQTTSTSNIYIYNIEKEENTQRINIYIKKERGKINYAYDD